MPFPFTMRHYQIFGETTQNLKHQELLSPESWDALREHHPFFSISSNREEWLLASEIAVTKDGQDTHLKERARDIVALLRERCIDRIFSVGVGGAALEYHLKKLMPEIQLTCSDYSETTVKRLREVFLESDAVIEFDILMGDWNEIQKKYIGEHGLCLMYRLDAGFSDTEWADIFEKMAEAGIAQVLVIPTGTLSLISVFNRKKREILWFLKGIPTVWCGYVRTEKRFTSQWRAVYIEKKYVLGGLKSFFLTKRSLHPELSSHKEKEYHT